MANGMEKCSRAVWDRFLASLGTHQCTVPGQTIPEQLQLSQQLHQILPSVMLAQKEEQEPVGK